MKSKKYCRKILPYLLKGYAMLFLVNNWVEHKLDSTLFEVNIYGTNKE